MILYLLVVALVAHSAVSLDTTKTLTSHVAKGCKRKDGTEMKLGESMVIDNLKHQCLGMGSSVF
ncbi:hypothetical protein CRE_20588 [Caenorhabditis remanei]|uniref:Uncharacterized protein n=1 Tax=Caenorhabditis remanei TaxID=31234 RepID=E3NIV5_CAERE|nr:hypothetical protein CRE_20588 [Caenorhabditis remanei]